MRRLTLFALVAVAVFAGPAAVAQGYMDLPGMGAAEKVAPAPEAEVTEAEVTQAAEPADAVTAETIASTPGEAPDEALLAPIRSMPGGSLILTVGGQGTVEVGVGAARGSADAGATRGSILLVTLAALGSLTSVAWLVALRRQGVV